MDEKASASHLLLMTQQGNAVVLTTGQEIYAFYQMCVPVCVFEVETKVEDKQPIASQETEQPSVPLHTGNLSKRTHSYMYSVSIYKSN